MFEAADFQSSVMAELDAAVAGSVHTGLNLLPDTSLFSEDDNDVFAELSLPAGSDASTAMSVLDESLVPLAGQETASAPAEPPALAKQALAEHTRHQAFSTRKVNSSRTHPATKVNSSRIHPGSGAKRSKKGKKKPTLTELKQMAQALDVRNAELRGHVKAGHDCVNTALKLLMLLADP
eukprot:TRINITY_DN11752_c0_g2_i1.p1 TRINITY_DN11752_c0_g2~~TRINITY_DN11752_c0_g2_i1.p1  ORF type:complete len:179 (+),score=54.21 TRINITY_DN11752_c0_g2_i1:358-894(+)